MKLSQEFNNYRVTVQANRAPSSTTSQDLCYMVDTLIPDVPNFRVLRERLSYFDSSQCNEIKNRVVRIFDFLKQDNSKVNSFEKITQSDCVSVIVGKLDRIVGLLEGRGLDTALVAAKEAVLRDIITCFVNTPALRDIYDYATITKKWFYAQQGVRNYNPHALFNLEFNLDLGDEHFVNTFVNNLAPYYALPVVGRNVDHHTIEFKGVDRRALSDKIFVECRNLMQDHLVQGHGMPMEVRNIDMLLDKLVRHLEMTKTHSYRSVEEYAGKVYGLHRYYSVKLDHHHDGEDLKAALLLHLIPYMSYYFVDTTLAREDTAQLWLANSAAQLCCAQPSNLNGDGYPKLEKILNTMLLTIKLSDLPSGDLGKRFCDAFQVSKQGSFKIEAKHFVDYDDDYRLHYKASRHTLLTIIAGMAASQQGLVVLTRENIQAQIAFLVWQQNPDQNQDLYQQVCKSWGVVSVDEQQVRMREIMQKLCEKEPAPPLAHPVQNTSPNLLRDGSTHNWKAHGNFSSNNTGKGVFSNFSSLPTRGGRPGDGLATMLDAFVKRPYSYTIADTHIKTIKKDFSELQFNERKLLNILECARLNPSRLDFPLNANQDLKKYMAEHKNFLATYCVLVLATCTGNPAQEKWLRNLFTEIQRVMAEPVDKSIDQRVDRFFSQNSNGKKFADVLSRPLTPQMYRVSNHFFSMEYDSFKKIATAVNEAKKIRSKEGIWARTRRLLVWFWYLITFRRPVHEVIRTYGFFNKNKRAEVFYRNYTGLRP